MFLALRTYDKQLTIEKTGLSNQVWSHEGSTFKKKMTLNSHFSRPAQTDPYIVSLIFIKDSTISFLETTIIKQLDGCTTLQIVTFL